MEKVPLCLDLDALRSLVIGIEKGSFAAAAQRLCRSTSAVSAQLKKLEAQCDTALVVKKGRHLELTASGEIILSYARRMLALNDEAQQAVKGELLQGEICFGMQEDFGESVMPGILGQFSRQHPGLKITARVDRNQTLMDALGAGTLDLALVWQPETGQYDRIGQCELDWIYHRNVDLLSLIKSNEPLPLVMFDTPCLMRSKATAALDRAGIPWRIVFTSHSLSGIWAAVQAGLGVTVRTKIGMPTTLQPSSGLLPSPGTIGISLLQAAGVSPDSARRVLHNLIKEAVSGFSK
ncbi:LysR substrate-binding domain-containing protein [Erwinia sp. CGal63]|uniref:LysR substrate-binding domain-containing protein n=1 Tax=Erwinia sp. CGal63 TaxID=2919889 RepID=UPI00300B218B